jgi:hypothetical protein
MTSFDNVAFIRRRIGLRYGRQVQGLSHAAQTC